MYFTMEIASRIKEQAKRKHVLIKEMLAECNLNVNTVSDFGKGQQLSCISLAKIADYLDCSVDYLLGRTSDPNAHKETRPVLQIENEPRYKVRFAGRDGSIGEKYLTKEEIDALDALPDADDL